MNFHFLGNHFRSIFDCGESVCLLCGSQGEAHLRQKILEEENRKLEEAKNSMEEQNANLRQSVSDVSWRLERHEEKVQKTKAVGLMQKLIRTKVMQKKDEAAQKIQKLVGKKVKREHKRKEAKKQLSELENQAGHIRESSIDALGLSTSSIGTSVSSPASIQSPKHDAVTPKKVTEEKTASDASTSNKKSPNRVTNKTNSSKNSAVSKSPASSDDDAMKAFLNDTSDPSPPPRKTSPSKVKVELTRMDSSVDGLGIKRGSLSTPAPSGRLSATGTGISSPNSTSTNSAKPDTNISTTTASPTNTSKKSPKNSSVDESGLGFSRMGSALDGMGLSAAAPSPNQSKPNGVLKSSNSSPRSSPDSSTRYAKKVSIVLDEDSKN